MFLVRNSIKKRTGGFFCFVFSYFFYRVQLNAFFTHYYPPLRDKLEFLGQFFVQRQILINTSLFYLNTLFKQQRDASCDMRKTAQHFNCQTCTWFVNCPMNSQLYVLCVSKFKLRCKASTRVGGPVAIEQLLLRYSPLRRLLPLMCQPEVYWGYKGFFFSVVGKI